MSSALVIIPPGLNRNRVRSIRSIDQFTSGHLWEILVLLFFRTKLVNGVH